MAFGDYTGDKALFSHHLWVMVDDLRRREVLGLELEVRGHQSDMH